MYTQRLESVKCTTALVGLNLAGGVAASLLPSLALSSSSDALAASPWTLLTFMFVHPLALHLWLNVAALILAGIWFERLSGPIATLAVYIAGGLTGGVFFLCATVVSGAEDMSLCGASASVLALAAAAAAMRRKALFSILTALVALALASGVVGPNPGGAIAHLGGLAAGWCIGRSMKPAAPLSTSEDIARKLTTSGFDSLSADERSSFFNDTVSPS